MDVVRPAIVVLKDTARQLEPAPGLEVTRFQALRERLGGLGAARLLLHYRSATLATYRHDTLYRPLRQALLLRLLSRGPCWFEDDAGSRIRITAARIAGLALQSVWDAARLPWLGRRLNARLAALERIEVARAGSPRQLRARGRPVYLRTDLVFDNRAGGSVGHIAGVLNSLAEFVAPPLFVTTDTIPTVRPEIETRLLPMPRSFRYDVERSELVFTIETEPFLEAAVTELPPAFLYQRYSRANFGGVALAQRTNVPLVLEYNGSEVWVSRNWGRPLREGALTARIERLNLQAADLVVVVSSVLKDELVSRGVEAERILVNPNGVDPERYSPSVSGAAVRRRHSLDRCLVIGFIGTFGRWHGAEVLAQAFAHLLLRQDDLRGRVKLLMIGDGETLPATRDKVASGGYGDEVVFTGLVPQAEGPEHLAACDVLVAPHVPNPDGSGFFGSPTKLFEYMAMGRGIVASRLGQMAEVLEDGRTALLTEPGNPLALAAGLARIVGDDALRAALGWAARDDAVRRYSWKEHTRRTLEALRLRCAHARQGSGR